MTHVYSDDVRRIAAGVLKLYDGKPERWTKGALARDESGWATAARDHEIYGNQQPAVCWCVMGAAEAVRRDWEDRGFQPFIDVFTVLLGQRIGFTDPGIGPVNDHEKTTFEDVVAVLKEMTT